MSRFWRSFPKRLGTQVKLSIAFHLQIDGQEDRTIQTPKNMLRSCVIDFKGSWDEHFPLVEFCYNHSYHSTISTTPFESLYGRRCSSPVGWFEVGEFSLLGPKLIYKFFGESLCNKG